MTGRILLHTEILALRWGDMDALGHVNNIVYLQYFEEARVHWMTQLGSRLDSKSAGMILARTTVDYKRPLTWPGSVELRQFAGPVGRSSFTLQGEITARESGELACTGEFVLVWFDYAQQRSAPLPEWLRAALGQAGAAA